MKILAFTSIRSDYDIMSPLYKLLASDRKIKFKILVSGAHLSTTHGYTLNIVEQDKLPILAKIETLLASDSRLSRIKSASILLQNSLEIINAYHPDVLIYAGDREDVLIYSMIGGYLNIPTIHFYGGDHGEDGYIDNPTRHATSKLSTYHFVSTKRHKQRLIHMGEQKDRIFVVGNISLDNFRNFIPYTKEKLGRFFQKNIKPSFALLIFHPITGEISKADIIFENILQALEKNNIFTFVSSPNTDPGNQKILKIISKYKNNNNFIFYHNLSRDIFLSIYHHSCFIIGNSSSGICESASIPIPAINVGLRQKGREANKNVIFTKTDFNSIDQAIQGALNQSFLNQIKNIKNLYGDGNSAKKAYNILRTLDINKMLLKTEDPLRL